MAKSTEELLQQAVVIRDEKANKKNTALRVGTLFSDVIQKQDEDVTALDKSVEENKDKLSLLGNNVFRTGSGGYLPWQAGKTYNDGDVVIAPDGQLVECIGGTTSTSEYDPGEWAATTVDEQSRKRDTKISNIASSSGHVVCQTGGPTAAKTITVDGITEITDKLRLLVQMNFANTAGGSVTLNINNLGAKTLYYNGATVSAINTWETGEIVELYYANDAFQCYNAKGGSGNAGNMILEWNINVATTRKQVKAKDRKEGMQISYNNPDNGWVNEQYIGSSITDTEWVKDVNWNKIAIVSDVDTAIDYSANIASKSLGGTILSQFKYFVGGQYIRTKAWVLGGIANIEDKVTSNNSMYAVIPVKKGETYQINGYYSYSSFHSMVITDEIYKILYISDDSVKKEYSKNVYIQSDGYIILNYYEITSYLDYVSVYKFDKKEDGISVSVNSERLFESADRVFDIPLSDRVNRQLVGNDGETIQTTFGREYLEDNAFGGAYFTSEKQFKYQVLKDDGNNYYIIPIKCSGYNRLYLTQDKSTQYSCGIFRDVDGNILDGKISYYFGAESGLEGKRTIAIPKDAYEAWVLFYDTKENVSNFECILEKDITSLTAEEAKKYRIYNLNSTNGLIDVLELQSNGTQYKTKRIPISFGEVLEVKIRGTLRNVYVYPDMETPTYIGENLVGQYTADDNGYNVYYIPIVSPKAKYFDLLANFAYALSMEISIMRYSLHDTLDTLSQDNYYIGYTADYYASELIKISEGDCITHNLTGLMAEDVSNGATPGLIYYDNQLNIVGYNTSKAESSNSFVSEYAPTKTACVQLLVSKKYLSVSKATIKRRDRLFDVNVLSNNNKDVISSVVQSANSNNETVNIGDELYHIDYTSNTTNCIIDENTYLVIGGWSQLRKGAVGTSQPTPGVCLWMKKTNDGGKTWSKIKILLETINWTTKERESGRLQSLECVYMHSPSVILNNDKLILQFTLDNNPSVDEELGVLSGSYKKRICYITSDDYGENWSEIKDMTQVVIDKFGAIESVYGSYGKCKTSNGTILFSFYQFSADISGAKEGFLLYSTDSGETWQCSDKSDLLNNETSLCEVSPNNVMILVRAMPGIEAKKRVLWLNVSNALSTFVQDATLTNSRLFPESVGYGEEGEYTELTSIRLNDRYAYLWAAQGPDTHNISLYVTHDFKKLIPVHCVHSIKDWDKKSRIYSWVSVKDKTILLVTKASDGVRAYNCSGVYDRLGSIGMVDDVKQGVDEITFSMDDGIEGIANKLNQLTQTLKINGYMKDWRDYTNRFGYSSEVLPSNQYKDNFIKDGGVNQGLAYMRKIVEGKFKIRIKLPATNYPLEALTVQLQTTWTSGASVKTYQANITNRQEDFITAEYSGDSLPYGELLYIYYYKDVSKDVAKTDGIKIEIFE